MHVPRGIKEEIGLILWKRFRVPGAMWTSARKVTTVTRQMEASSRSSTGHSHRRSALCSSSVSKDGYHLNNTNEKLLAVSTVLHVKRATVHLPWSPGLTETEYMDEPPKQKSFRLNE